jgi:hypothetical protein
MPLKAKIRFDFQVSNGENRRFFWQRPDLLKMALEKRAKQVSLLKNLPFQGLSVADLNSDQEVYLVPEDDNHPETAYAPVELLVEADSIEDLMQLTFRDEFRKIKVIEPHEVFLTHSDIERFLFKANEEYHAES